MENRVCDLEQLEERDPESRGRRAGMVVMATLGIVGLTFAMGVVVGKAAEPRGSEPKDALDQLDRVAAAGASMDARGAQPVPPPAKVEPADLTFPATLTDAEDRPEVLAALAAADQEAQALDAPKARALEPEAVAEPARVEAEEPRPARDDRVEARLQATLPASLAAGAASRELQKASQRDPLIARALPDESAAERAPHGSAGEYTLQVISYDAPGPAQAFASGLRGKGHEAFVASADVPERGRYYRVRIGPFKTRAQAEAYRSEFEADEHMNTIVVKRAKGE